MKKAGGKNNNGDLELESREVTSRDEKRAFRWTTSVHPGVDPQDRDT